MLEEGVVVGRIFLVPVAPEDCPLDVGERPQRRLSPGDARLRADARSGDGGVREVLAATHATPE